MISTLLSVLLCLGGIAEEPNTQMSEALMPELQDSVSEYLYQSVMRQLSHAHIAQTVCSSDGVELKAVLVLDIADQSARDRFWDSGVVNAILDTVEEKASDFTSDELLSADLAQLFTPEELFTGESSELATAFQSIEFRDLSREDLGPVINKKMGNIIVLPFRSPNEEYFHYIMSHRPSTSWIPSDPLPLVLLPIFLAYVLPRSVVQPVSDDEDDEDENPDEEEDAMAQV